MKQVVLIVGLFLTMAGGLHGDNLVLEYNLDSELVGLRSEFPGDYLLNSKNWIYGLSAEGLPAYRGSLLVPVGLIPRIDSTQVERSLSLPAVNPGEITYFNLTTDAERKGREYHGSRLQWHTYGKIAAALEYRYSIEGQDYYNIFFKPLIAEQTALIIYPNFRVFVSLPAGQALIPRTGKGGTSMQAVLSCLSEDSPSPRIDNDAVNLTAAETDGPGYLIITSSALAESFESFLLWKRALGFTAALVTVEEIENRYMGIDRAERIREFLKVAYLNGLEWLLIGGDETVVPVRKLYAANTDDPIPEQYLHPSDLYYADLTGTWDGDGDGIWGEPYHDNPDLQPELFVGRIPADSPLEIENWIQKTLAYEKGQVFSNPGFAEKALITSADQMRDWNAGQGQDSLIAGYFPETITLDLTSMAEYPSGFASDPSQPPANSFIQLYSEGWNLAVILAHGVDQGFVSMSSGYNEWPKTYVWCGTGTEAEVGYLENLTNAGAAGIMYSVACSQGAFDRDNAAGNCFAEDLLILPERGAAAMIGYTRYGWVASSYLLAEKFVEILYSQDNRLGPANTISKLYHSCYRDLNYGLNLFGDPALPVWTSTPSALNLEHPEIIALGENQFTVSVQAGGAAVENALVTVINANETLFTGFTSVEGTIELAFNTGLDSGVILTASKINYIPYQVSLSTSIVLDADDEQEDHGLPTAFALYQNYPNPANPETRIGFDLPSEAEAEFEVFNLLGQKVGGESAGNLPAGYHEIILNLSDYSSGVYFYRLTAGEYSACKKLMLLK